MHADAAGTAADVTRAIGVQVDGRTWAQAQKKQKQCRARKSDKHDGNRRDKKDLADESMVQLMRIGDIMEEPKTGGHTVAISGNKTVAMSKAPNRIQSQWCAAHTRQQF